MPAHVADSSSRSITFSYRGKAIAAREGQSVASALHEAGVRSLTRSVKYRRPRGIYCASGNCPNCLMQVDGLPFTPTCITRVAAGMAVDHNGPSTRGVFDLVPPRLRDVVGSAFPVGFQYKLFKRQQRGFRVWERLLRRIAADTGIAPAARAGPAVRKLCPDLLVVGAGPAGIGAALAAADAELDVVLVSRWWGTAQADRVAARWASTEPSAAGRASRVSTHPKVLLLAPASAVTALDGLFLIDHAGLLVEVAPTVTILATGAYERSLSFEANDLPGVMLTSAAVKLITRDGTLPGRGAVVATRDDFAYAAAALLRDGGVEVHAVVDERRTLPDTEAVRRLREKGVPMHVGSRVERASGRRGVRSVTVRTARGSQQISCDLVCASGGWQAADELYYQATSRGHQLLAGQRATPIDWSRDSSRVEACVLVAGALVGRTSFSEAWHEGRVAGLEASRRLGRAVGGQLAAAAGELEALTKASPR